MSSTTPSPTRRECFFRIANTIYLHGCFLRNTSFNAESHVVGAGCGRGRGDAPLASPTTPKMDTLEAVRLDSGISVWVSVCNYCDVMNSMPT